MVNKRTLDKHMSRQLFRAFLILVVVAPVSAQAPPDTRLVLDLWDVAYLQGARAGHVHTSVHEITRHGVKLHRALMELRLTVKRAGETIQLGMDAGTEETAPGKVVGTFMKHYLGKAKTLEIVGTVDNGSLKLTLDKTKELKAAPWKDDVIGLARQVRLFQQRDVKPGDRFTYHSFEPSINLVVKNSVSASDYEEVELFGGQQKKRLLRVESRPEKIHDFQLPTLVSWLGDDLMPLRSEAEIPPFGRVVLYRTTKNVATSPAAVARLTDISTSQYVSLSRTIANPYGSKSAIYRITVRGEDDPKSLFARDERQRVKTATGQTIELEVREDGNKPVDGKKPSAEFSQSSYFINCSDARVKSLARAAVGEEKDSWKKAVRIERWVKQNMKVTSDEALAPADHVARTLRGDCTEYAMLTAAMCRAVGIPSRTAVGLIYADIRTGPVFAFHMWTEIWVQGQWRGLDATLGRGGIGATHLKIGDHGWHETYDQGPLLPVFRMLGRLSIEVLRAE